MPANKNEQDLEEFQTLAHELVKSAFSFNGQETLDTLDTWQLDVLRSHQWKRRVAQELNDGEEFSNREEAIAARKGHFDAEGSSSAAQEEKYEPMFRTTRDQKKTVTVIADQMKAICARMFADDQQLCDQAEALMGEEDEDVTGPVVSFALELTARLQSRMIEESDADRSENVDLIVPEESLNNYPVRQVDGEIQAVPSGASLKRMTSRQRKVDISSSAKVQEMYTEIIGIERHDKVLKLILQDHVTQIAFKMQKEGIIAAPPLVRLQRP